MALPPDPDPKPGLFSRLRAHVEALARPLANNTPLSAEARFPLLFGGVPLHPDDRYENSLIIGSRGSGKTLLLRLLLQSIVPQIGRRPWKLVLLDGKNELYSVLCALTDPAHITLTHPFDARSSAWALHEDIRSIEAALEFAAIYVPEDKRASQPFFDRAAGRLFYGVTVSFMEMKRTGQIPAYHFHDLIFACQDRHRLRQILAQSEIGEQVARKYFDVPERLSDVIATLDTKLAPFEPLAESSAEATSTFSLRRYMAGGPPLLLLGTDESNPVATQAFNRTLFYRLAEHLLARPNNDPADPDPPRTFVVIEEASKAGNLALDGLSVKGRGKGVVLHIITQSLAGLEAAYGKELTQETLGQFGNRALLRTDEPYTAQFCAELLGPERKFQYSESQGESCHFFRPQLQHQCLPLYRRRADAPLLRLHDPAAHQRAQRADRGLHDAHRGRLCNDPAALSAL